MPNHSAPLTVEQRKVIAHHESGHAVMRWLVGFPATAIRFTEDGGLCEGTGRRVDPYENALVLLAGMVSETECLMRPADLIQSHFQDLDEARALLAPEWMRCRGVEPDGHTPQLYSIDEYLLHLFEQVRNKLSPHAIFIGQLADRLMQDRHVSARSVAAICREYERRLEREEVHM